MKFHSLLLLMWIGLGGSIVSAEAQPQVIAHRGYWKAPGADQNSIASLQAAERIGAFGSECDIYLCADGGLMVFHDPELTIKGQKVSMETSPSTLLQSHILKNGEPMPSFDQYLEAFKACQQVQLIIELKSNHLSETQQTELAQKVIHKVKEAGLENRVQYIAFSRYLCEEVHRIDPQAQISYLNGDLSPRKIKALGLTGIDYYMSIFKKHPRWIRKARALGLSTNVWTVNDPEDMRYFIDQSIDYITTDQPETLQELLSTPTDR